jgi:hypothetical protein
MCRKAAVPFDQPHIFDRETGTVTKHVLARIVAPIGVAF